MRATPSVFRPLLGPALRLGVPLTVMTSMRRVLGGPAHLAQAVHHVLVIPQTGACKTSGDGSTKGATD